MSSALVACLALAVPRAAAHGAWRAVEPMPVALSDFTATPATTADGDDVVVVVGGCDDHQVSCDWWDGCSYCPSVAATARAFDVAADAWVDLAAPPRPRYRHAAAYDAENNLVYVVGGRDVDDGLVDAVDIYDVAADAWTTLPGVAVARSDLGAVVHGGALLVAGGYDLNYTAYATTLRVDVDSGAMTEGPPLLEARGDFGFALLGDVAYAVGGWSHEDWCAPLASVEALDLAADGAAFGAAAPLAVARGDKALASTGEALYVVGGEHNNGCATGSAPVDDVEALGDGAAAWSVEADIPEERFRTAAAAVGDYLYVFGGQAAESTSCTGFSYCFPVTDHVWRLSIHSHDDEGGDDDDDDDFTDSVAFAAAVAVAAVLLLAVAGAALFKACGTPAPSSEDALPIKGEVELPDGEDVSAVL